MVGFGHLLHQDIGQSGIYLCPYIDNLLVAFFVGYETHLEIFHHLIYLTVAVGHNLLFFRRNKNVAKVKGKTALECHTVAEILDIVKELGRTGNTAFLDNTGYNVAKRFLGKNSIDIAYLRGYELVNQHAAYRGILYQATDSFTVFVYIVYHHVDGSMQCNFAFVVCYLSLFRTIEGMSFALITLAQFGYVVQTKNHVLRRNGDWCAIGRVKDIVGAEHKHLSFQYCLITQWKVNSHLVTVKVGIKRRTCQRMKLDSLAFDKFRLECLDTKTVKSWCTVEQYRMTLHDIFKDIPYYRFLAVYNLLGALYSLNDTALNELADNKRLVKFCRHVLRQTAFVHLQLRTYNNYRTCGIVYTLTQKVLAETALLTFE